MTDLSKKKCLVIDTPDGIAIEHAVRLGRDFGKVWYVNYCVDSFPSFLKHATGIGMEGVEKVWKVQPYADQADIICFFDVGFGAEIEAWRKRGKAVFGGGKGEFLEENRGKARKIQERLGLPTQDTKEIKGVTALERHIKNHDDVWVKINEWRGDIKSFPAKNYACVALKFNEIRAAFGPFAEEIDFIVEEAIHDAVETGFDGFFNGLEFIRPCMWGLETDHAYLAKYDDTLPDIMEAYINAMSPVLKKLNYRGALSTEQRAIDAETSYMIDYTCRFAYPLSLIFTESMLNYSEVIWAVANGEPIKVKKAAKYAACAPITSLHAEKNWLRLIMDKKRRDRIKFQGVFKGEGYFHCVKGSQNGATLIGLGDSIDDCIEEIKEYAEYIDADGLEKDCIDVIDKIKKDIDKLDEIGIEF